MITTIVFDFGGVMLASDGADTVKFVIEAFGFSPKPTEQQLWEEVGPLQEGKISEATFWSELAVKYQGTLPKEWASQWQQFYLAHNFMDPEMSTLVQQLRQNGYRTPLLSNTISSHATVNKAHGRYALFEPVILSHEVGCSKPHPEIFQLLLKKIGKKAEECLFIDDVESFVMGARVVGMQAIHFTSPEALKTELAQRGVLISYT